MKKLKPLVMAILGCAALPAATPGGVQGAPAAGRYDIRGLTLGMTARQAEAIITQRLHVCFNPNSEASFVDHRLERCVLGGPASA